jgi:hypothetical protein
MTTSPSPLYSYSKTMNDLRRRKYGFLLISALKLSLKGNSPCHWSYTEMAEVPSIAVWLLKVSKF